MVDPLSLRTWLLAGVSLLAMTVPAAAVETIGLLVLSVTGVTNFTLFGIQGGITLAGLVGSAVLAGASIGLQALTNKPKTSTPQDGQIVTRQALPWRRRSYGQVMLAGPILFSETRGGCRYQVIALNQGEVAEFIQLRVNELGAYLDGGGAVLNAFTLEGQSFVYLEARAGLDLEVAFGQLTSIFPELWTADHRLNGIATMLVRTFQPQAKDFTKVYPGGQPPATRALVNSTKVWDPRLAQNKDSKATWTFSRNPVLQILDYVRHFDGMGLSSFDSVLITPAAITEDWIPAANICDQVMLSKLGDTIRRYTSDGGYLLNTPPKEVLASILSTCDGQLYQRPDGALGIRVGRDISPTVTIVSKNILQYEWRQGSSGRLQKINQTLAKYTDPRLDYQDTDADPWRDEAAITASGREEAQTIDLRWVSHHNQARRLMKLAHARANPKWSGKVTTNLDGVRSYNERYIRLQISDINIDEIFEITGPVELDPSTMTVTIPVASIPADVFDFDAATEEGQAPTSPDVTDPNVPVDEPQNVEAPNPDDDIFVITVSWDPPGRDDVVAEVQYSAADSAAWFAASIIDGTDTAETPPLTVGLWDIRVRFNIGGRSSEWVLIENVEISS